MDVRRHLADGLDYDDWATGHWRSALAGSPLEARGNEILTHLAETRAAWAKRLAEGLEVPEPAAGEVDRFLRATLAEAPLDREFTWIRRRTGEPYHSRVLDVFLHLPLHGTYHRGQLRGLAEAAEWTAFPETDYTIWSTDVQTEPGPEGAEIFERRFGHDAWGWRHFMASVAGSPIEARAAAVLRHHAGCPIGWGSGVAAAAGFDPPEELSADGVASITSAGEWWLRLLAERGPDFVFSWTRAAGGEASRTLEAMAVHVTNHGAYHRGHLRGLAEAADWDAFPDTDFVFFTDPRSTPG